MKTIKIKIELAGDQVDLFDRLREEATWIWNAIRSNELHNHCVEWYRWAEKQNEKVLSAKEQLQKLKPESQSLVLDYYYPRPNKPIPRLNEKQRKIVEKFSIFELWEPFDFDGIIRTPIRIGDSAWTGVSCQIAFGGRYWKEDDSINIPYKSKAGEIKYKKGSKLVDGDKPYTPISPIPHFYRTVPDGIFEGRLLDSLDKFDSVGVLNSIRCSSGLPSVTKDSSDFIGAVKNKFKTAWETFKSSSLQSRKKPRFKHDLVDTIINDQRAPLKIDSESKTIRVSVLGDLQVVDKSAFTRLNLISCIPRTYSISRKASGYYINTVVADLLEVEKVLIKKNLPKIKKKHGEDGTEYLEQQQKLELIESELKEKYRKSNKGLSIGIDPGVNAAIAGDHGALFRPNLTRERISIHIENIQSELDNVRLINDKKWKDSGNKGSRPATKNEIKLQAKISRLHERGANSAKSFNHKLSTRIARTYDHVCWEDTQLTNLLKQTEANANPEGKGYQHNGASSKRGLNWVMRQRCLGDLKAKTQQKVILRGNSFYEPPARNSSLTCSCCGGKGERRSQYEFVCKNQECERLDIVQQADINAARNHKRNSGFEIGIVKYNNVKLTYKRAKRLKQKRRLDARKNKA